MDTVDFLSKILPDEGLVVLAEFRNGAIKRHHFFPNATAAADKIKSLDASGADVYHACASYKTDVSRKQDNVEKLKSFFLDIDVGDNKEFKSRADAKAALVSFCEALKIHPPMLISSGRGLHCYWIFDTPVASNLWKQGAELLRRCTEALEFKVDPARTTDTASILRPVGATWRKDGERPVKPLFLDSPSRPFGWYIEKFNACLGDSAPVFSTTNAALALLPMERLGAERTFPPASAELIAERCGQVARMRDTKGALDEPSWRNVLGVLKHCVEGDVLAHQWSEGDPRYDYRDTQSKLDRWETGPTTCAQFERTNSEVCNACSFRGKVKSPMQVGQIEERVIPITPVAQITPPSQPPMTAATETSMASMDEDEQEGEFRPMVLPEAANMPYDYRKYFPADEYRWDGQYLQVYALNRDTGIKQWQKFCNRMVFPVMRIRDLEGDWIVRVAVFDSITDATSTFVFDFPAKELAKVDNLRSIFSAKLVHLKSTREGQFMTSYLTRFLDEYWDNGVGSITHPHYGWYDNETSFLIGKSMVYRNDEREVILDKIEGSASGLLHTPPTGGTLDRWTFLFNSLMSGPSMEKFQFTALALLAAPLVKIIGNPEWSGVPVGLTGDPGTGKTSIGLIACSAYGHGKSFSIPCSSSTLKSLYPYAHVMHNLPFVIDEFTGRNAEEISTLLYSMSDGKAGDRATITGKASSVQHSWKTIPLFTGNTSINAALTALDRQRGSAGQVRIFEMEISKDEKEKRFNQEYGEMLTEITQTTYGIAGRLGVRDMMSSKTKVQDKFAAYRRYYRNKGSTSYDTAERFLVDLVITARIGAELYSNLGLIKFDHENTMAWALEHLKTLRDGRDAADSSVEEMLSQFLSSLYGRMAVTKHIDGRIKEPLLESFPLRSEPVARMAINAKEFYVTANYFNQWCFDNKITPAMFRANLVAGGFLKDENRRVYLFAGTEIPSAQQRVMTFEYDKLKVSTAEELSAKVVPLR